jgi:hypothetical protein
MKRHFPIFLFSLWLLFVGAGMVQLAAYKGTPGPVDAAPEQWPTDSGMARATSQPTLVLFAHPQCESDLWRIALEIPGVTVQIDPKGEEAERFHVRTSGETLLYDRDGRLQFSGGITISRGHAGDNPGRISLAALVNGQPANESTTPAFGCPLFAKECQPGEGSCKK